jgi:hypothetical protein
MVMNELYVRAEKFFLYKLCFYICTSFWFTSFINLCIIGNTVDLSMESYPMDPNLSTMLDYLNLGFYCAFAFEMIAKMLGLGFRFYFKDGFNTFDCIVVCINTLDIIFSYSKIN